MRYSLFIGFKKEYTMNAYEKLNLLVSSALERGLTKTYVASLIDVSPRTLGRLQEGQEITPDRITLIDTALTNLGIKSSVAPVAPASKEDIVDSLRLILSLGAKTGWSKQAIADELGTSRRTLDRWVEGVHPIPEGDIRVDIADLLEEIEEEHDALEGGLNVEAPQAQGRVLANDVPEENVPVAPRVVPNVITYVTVGAGFGGLKTLANGFLDVSPRLAVIKGLDECDILVNKGITGDISISYIPGSDARVEDYFRQSTSFKRGEAKAYVVIHNAPVLVEGVTQNEIDNAKMHLEVGTGVVALGGNTYDVSDIAYLVLSPEFVV